MLKHDILSFFWKNHEPQPLEKSNVDLNMSHGQLHWRTIGGQREVMEGMAGTARRGALMHWWMTVGTSWWMLLQGASKSSQCLQERQWWVHEIRSTGWLLPAPGRTQRHDRHRPENPKVPRYAKPLKMFKASLSLCKGDEKTDNDLVAEDPESAPQWSGACLQ